MRPQFLDFLQHTLRSASAIATRHFGTVSGSVKTGDNNQVLTQADLEIGRHIIEQIEKVFPEHNIIDEEAGVIDKKHQMTWVVDPIDGTSNFAAGLPTYGVMIGLLDGDRAVAGGIALPAFSEIYLAEKGCGATCNGAPIRVSTENNPLNLLVAYGIDGHQEDSARTHREAALLGEIVLSIRNLRTTNSAYDMAHVCDGKYGAYLNQTTKIWDNVALQPIIEEAGGVVTDFWGTPMNYANALERTDETFTICAGGVEVCGELLKIVRKHSS